MLDAAGGRLEFHIDYDPNRLCRRQIEEMSAYYSNTLRAMAVNRRAATRSFLPCPRRKGTACWRNGTTQRRITRATNPFTAFSTAPEDSPLKTALVADDEEWTYRDLNRRANDVARKLIELGAGPNTLVGICMERTANMVAGLLGILKTGAAYVPIGSLLFPRSGWASCWRCEISKSWSPKQISASVAGHEGRYRAVLMHLTMGARTKTEPSDPSRADLAYVIYTSGSTGKPKGVQVTTSRS